MDDGRVQREGLGDVDMTAKRWTRKDEGKVYPSITTLWSSVGGFISKTSSPSHVNDVEPRREPAIAGVSFAGGDGFTDPFVAPTEPAVELGCLTLEKRCRVELERTHISHQEQISRCA